MTGHIARNTDSSLQHHIESNYKSNKIFIMQTQEVHNYSNMIFKNQTVPTLLKEALT